MPEWPSVVYINKIWSTRRASEMEKKKNGNLSDFCWLDFISLGSPAADAGIKWYVEFYPPQDTGKWSNFVSIEKLPEIMSIIFIFSSSVATDPILRIRKHDNASYPTRLRSGIQ